MRIKPRYLLGICSLAACQPLPGEVVGTYAVTMELEENTCGNAAVHPLDGNKYSVELREDDEHAYWRIPSQTPIEGSYNAPRFEFELESLVASSVPDGGTLPCRLIQTELLTGRVALSDAGVTDVDLDAGESEEDERGKGLMLLGKHELNISAEPGGDCSEALPPKGAFQKLPCVLRYQLRGVNRKPL
jgi:hypothetical protein